MDPFSNKSSPPRSRLFSNSKEENAVIKLLCCYHCSLSSSSSLSFSYLLVRSLFFSFLIHKQFDWMHLFLTQFFFNFFLYFFFLVFCENISFFYAFGENNRSPFKIWRTFIIFQLKLLNSTPKKAPPRKFSKNDQRLKEKHTLKTKEQQNSVHKSTRLYWKLKSKMWSSRFSLCRLKEMATVEAFCSAAETIISVSIHVYIQAVVWRG